MKLDLHTHCCEATNMAPPDARIVREIIAMARARGLDGLAITEHGDSAYAYRVLEIAERLFDREVLIIPGQEVRRGLWHVVELYLPGGATFRFIAHPVAGSLHSVEVSDIHGIEVENGNWALDRKRIEEFAREHDLLLLSNSDAHSLNLIGEHYTEVALEELYRRAAR